MASYLWFVVDYTSKESDRTAKGITSNIYYNTPSGPTYRKYNIDCAQYQFNTSYNIRVTCGTSDKSYDLGTLIRNAKYYVKSGGGAFALTENKTYAEAKAIIEANGTELTFSEFAQATDVSIVYDNYLIAASTNNFASQYGMKANSLTTDYAIILPTPYYTEIGTYRSYSQTLTNCTSDILADYITTDATTITISADTGYEFSNDYPITVTGASYTVSYSQDMKEATINVDAGENAISVSARAIIYAYLDFTNMSNATCNILPTTPLVVGETYTITITANSGYYFDIAPTIRYYEITATGLIRPATLTLTPIEQSEFPTSFSGNWSTQYYDSTTYTLPVNAVASVLPQSDKYGLITIYNPTPSELNDLSNERFVYNGTPISSVIDLGDYILTLIRLFVFVPVYLREYIKLGGHVTTVESNVVVQDIIESNCGTVEIEPYFNNAMDYTNTYIRFYLPFVGFANIDSNLVMGDEISLVYKTNVINGDSLAILIDSNDNILATYNCNVSYEIPYLLNQSNNPQGKLKIDSSYLYGFTPFVEITRDGAYNTSNLKAQQNIYISLNSLEGFNRIEVPNVAINRALKEEQDMIKNMLREGVIF